MSALQIYITFAGAWHLINGILHTFFVLRQKRKYDKELIRLLMDGHILIFAGIMYLICIQSLAENSQLAEIICFSNSLFVLGYCAIIYRILPSITTIIINLVAFTWLITAL
ncbi:MAG: hypothetical protein ACKVPJ_11165 [Chitinophagales bacterium]